MFLKISQATEIHGDLTLNTLCCVITVLSIHRTECQRWLSARTGHNAYGKIVLIFSDIQTLVGTNVFKVVPCFYPFSISIHKP